MIRIGRVNGTEIATIDAPSVRAAVASHLAAGGTLIGADLRGAYLAGATLTRADLRGADLRGADLEFADLRDADLAGANLSGANLAGANLADADLSEADLGGTCLDPAAPVPDATAGLLAAGLRIADGWVYAWRTATSTHVGATDYSKPGEYAAPWFSVAVYTDCHPGIYFARRGWLTSVYPNVPIVAIRARVADVVATRGGMFRARRLEVLA